MGIRIIELKANCHNPGRILDYLHQHGKYIGRDHQVDTYFQVPSGRLKLRNGTIEKSLIAYNRPNVSGQKKSEVQLYRTESPEQLVQVLEQALSVLVVVDKWRHIFFIDNVKFHVDEVAGLGTFVEIEAIDEQGERTEVQLQNQCQHFRDVLGIQPEHLCSHSYSDMLMDLKVQ